MQSFGWLANWLDIATRAQWSSSASWWYQPVVWAISFETETWTWTRLLVLRPLISLFPSAVCALAVQSNQLDMFSPAVATTRRQHSSSFLEITYLDWCAFGHMWLCWVRFGKLSDMICLEEFSWESFFQTFIGRTSGCWDAASLKLKRRYVLRVIVVQVGRWYDKLVSASGRMSRQLRNYVAS